MNSFLQRGHQQPRTSVWAKLRSSDIRIPQAFISGNCAHSIPRPLRMVDWGRGFRSLATHCQGLRRILWMDDIHSVHPSKPWNEMIPCNKQNSISWCETRGFPFSITGRSRVAWASFDSDFELRITHISRVSTKANRPNSTLLLP